MDCPTCRRILSESGPPVGPAAEVDGVVRHLRACGECRSWLDAEREWRATLRDRLIPRPAPLEAKERLFATLAGVRVGVELRRQRRRLAAAFVVTVLLGVSAASLLWWNREERGFLVSALTEDHLLYASQSAPAEFASDDPRALSRWFADRLDFSIAAPQMPGTELLGGRLCTLGGRRAALSLYQRGDRRLSLFQMPAEGLPLGSLRPMKVEGRRYHCGHRKGVSVLAWQESDIFYALVSDLPEKDLLTLARF